MTNPKPVKMWACFRPDGQVVLNTIKPHEAMSKRNCVHNFPARYATWESLSSRGYRCIRVTITPDPESEK